MADLASRELPRAPWGGVGGAGERISATFEATQCLIFGTCGCQTDTFFVQTTFLTALRNEAEALH